MLPRYQVIRVAAEAGRDPRTVERYLKGERVQPMAAEGIRGALKKLGLPEPDARAGE